MGTTYLTDGDDLTSVANAIRAKSGGSSQLAFPAGFVSEIGNIPSGGGGLTLLTSGSYTIASNQTTFTIQFSTSGTPLFAYVEEDEEISGVARSVAWVAANVSQLRADVRTMFPQFMLVRGKAANGNLVSPSATIGNTQATYGLHDDYILCAQASSNYSVKANTYNWYVWGLSA